MSRASVPDPGHRPLPEGARLCAIRATLIAQEREELDQPYRRALAEAADMLELAVCWSIGGAGRLSPPIRRRVGGVRRGGLADHPGPPPTCRPNSEAHCWISPGSPPDRSTHCW